MRFLKNKEMKGLGTLTKKHNKVLRFTARCEQQIKRAAKNKRTILRRGQCEGIAARKETH